MRKLGAQSDGSPLLELVIGGRPITEKRFGWRNGSILLVNRLFAQPSLARNQKGLVLRDPLGASVEQSHFWMASFSLG